MGENTEDDKNVTNNSDNDQTTQNKNGEDSFPVINMLLL